MAANANAARDTWGPRKLPVLLLLAAVAFIYWSSASYAPNTPSLHLFKFVLTGGSHWIPATPRRPPSPLAAPLPPPYLLEWAHIPKTGTSFGNTLVLWACPELNFSRLWVKEGLFSLPATCVARFREIFRGSNPIGGHERLSSRTEEELRRVFTMVRSPPTWLVSIYHFLGPGRENATEEEMCAWLGRNAATRFATRGTLVIFVAGRPSVWNPCLAGLPVPDSWAPSSAMVEEACRRLRVFAFTGITDYWDASVCLFHAIHGGETHPVELRNLRKGSYKESGSSLKAVECAHESDMRLFGCAMELFREKLRQHPQCERHLPPEARPALV